MAGRDARGSFLALVSIIVLLQAPAAAVAQLNAGDILVAASPLMRVDPTTGTRTALAIGGSAIGFAIDASGQILLVQPGGSFGHGVLARVDPITGSSTPVSDLGNDSQGPRVADPAGMTSRIRRRERTTTRSASTMRVAVASTPRRRRAARAGQGPAGSGLRRAIVYGDKLLDPDGLLKIVLNPGAAGKARITVKGKSGNLGMPVLPLLTPLRVQLLRGSSRRAGRRRSVRPHRTMPRP